METAVEQGILMNAVRVSIQKKKKRQRLPVVDDDDDDDLVVGTTNSSKDLWQMSCITFFLPFFVWYKQKNYSTEAAVYFNKKYYTQCWLLFNSFSLRSLK